MADWQDLHQLTCFGTNKQTTRLSPSSFKQHTIEQCLTNILFRSLNVNIERKHVETVNLYFQQMAREFIFTYINRGCLSV